MICLLFKPFQIPDKGAFFVQILLLSLLFIGLFLAVRNYKKEKNISRIILIFLLFEGFSFVLGNILTPYSEIFRFIPFLSTLAVLIFVGALIVLNIRLEKRVEQRTKEAESIIEKYRNLVYNIVDIIFELDSNYIISYISPQAKDLLNYLPMEMKNHKINEFICAEEVNEVKQKFSKTFDGIRPTLIDCRMVSKEGEFLDVSIRGSLVINEGTKKIIGVIRDITDQKKAEKVLRDQYENLKEIDKIRTDLLRRTSHELKTPLISLFSSTQYILDTYQDKMNEEIKKYIQIINRGGKRLKHLTSNLLDAYNIENKGLKLEKEKVNLTKSVQNCITDFFYTLKQRDLYIKKELEEKIYIELDKARIEQVILNLLSNAIKNTPPKGLIFVKLEKNEKFADIIIKDTGIGLTEEEKKHLFKKFGKIERQNEETDLITEGSGLGLYLSKQIIDLHEGKILAESEGRNKGATFTVRLPINFP